MDQKTKKVLMIVASRDFRDEEYFVPCEIFKKEGIEVETASNTLGIAYGKLGGEVLVDILLEKVKAEDYQAIVLVGGPGAQNYFEDSTVHQIVRMAIQKNLVLGAICIAPVILAKAKVLGGKKATVWTSPLDKSAVRYLEEGGAQYVAEKVVSDGKIITACGPEAAKEFAETIVQRIV